MISGHEQPNSNDHSGGAVHHEIHHEIHPEQTPSQLACSLLADGVLGPDASGVVLAGCMSPDELWFLATAGYLGDVHSNRSVQLSLHFHAPLPLAVWTGQPVVLRDVDELIDRFPYIATLLPRAEAVMAIPAVHAGNVLGALGITYRRPQPFDDVTVAALTRIAALVAEHCLAPIITGSSDHHLDSR